MSYDVICNATLWFCLHGLYDLPRRPRIDRHWRAAWEAYRAVNEAFADAAADLAPEGAVVLVQDYHLALVGSRLRAARPDLATVHFMHTPWCDPDGLRPLPSDVARELIGGIAGNSAATFHTHRWADAFSASHRTFMGEAAPPRVVVTPLASDPEDLAATAASPACAQQRDALDANDRRPQADRASRSHRAVEEHPARVPRVRRAPDAASRVAGTSGVRRAALPLA